RVRLRGGDGGRRCEFGKLRRWRCAGGQEADKGVVLPGAARGPENNKGDGGQQRHNHAAQRDLAIGRRGADRLQGAGRGRADVIRRIRQPMQKTLTGCEAEFEQEPAKPVTEEEQVCTHTRMIACTPGAHSRGFTYLLTSGEVGGLTRRSFSDSQWLQQ